MSPVDIWVMACFFWAELFMKSVTCAVVSWPPAPTRNTIQERDHDNG